MSSPGPRDAVITGVGLVTAVGSGRRAHEGCLDRPPGVPTPLASFDASAMPVQAAFQVTDLRPQPFMLRRKDLKLMSRDACLALQAAGLALTDAGIDPMAPASWPVSPEEVGLVMGVGLEPGDIVELGPVLADCASGGRVDLRKLGAESIDLIPPLSSLKTLPNMALAHVSINLGLMGIAEAFSPWGTSGIQALGVAAEAIERGECDMVLVGAADSDVDLGGISTHFRAGLLAPLRADGASRASADGVDPYADSVDPSADSADPHAYSVGGLISGEAGAFLVLESRALAQRRGATILGVFAGQTACATPIPTMPGFDPEGLEAALGPLLALGDALVNSAAGHNARWRAIEAAAFERLGAARLVRPSDHVGSCAAASGLVDLAVMLAARPGEPVVALSWGPSGEWAAARIEPGEGR